MIRKILNIVIQILSLNLWRHKCLHCAYLREACPHQKGGPYLLKCARNHWNDYNNMIGGIYRQEFITKPRYCSEYLDDKIK